MELGTGARGQKTRMMGLPGRVRSLTISSAVWIQYTNVTDGQTDGHRATAKSRLRIASRGKNLTSGKSNFIIRVVSTKKFQRAHRNETQKANSAVTLFLLHCALGLAAQCIVIGPVCGFVGLCVCVCLWVCYHDNSKLRASIFTKLGL